MPQQRIFAMSFASVYPLYVQKAERKNSALVSGVVCGVRVEEVDDSLMRQIRAMDKLIDELARGKAMEKILR